MMIMSPSRLKKMTCLRRYDLYYNGLWRRRWPKAIWKFGHACHSTVTAFLNSGHSINPVDCFVATWNIFKGQKLEYGSNDTFKGFMDIGKALAEQMPKALGGITGIHSIEGEFLVPFKNYKMRGFIDFIGKLAKKQTLFDTKTLKACDKNDVKMSDQLTMYSMAKQIPDVALIALFKLKTNPHIKIFKGTRTKESHLDMHKKIIGEMSRLKQGYYPMANDRTTCNMCDFRPICFGTKTEVRQKLAKLKPKKQQHKRNGKLHLSRIGG